MTELLQIKRDFNIVKNSRDDILNIFQTLKSKMQTLKTLYKQMIITHKQKKEHMFGIDSFYFQNKLIEIQFENMKKIFNAIDNRMYCEYYKLHVIIQDFINKEVDDELLSNKITIKKKYPPYKNLEPLKVYGFNLVKELQELTINTIIELESYNLAKDNELENDNSQSVLGLNIGNLVNSYRYSNAMLKEKIRMFSGYLETFHEHHTKYLYRLSVQLKLILKNISDDIRIKQFNQFDNRSKDNVSSNFKKSENTNRNTHNAIPENVVLNNTTSRDDFTKTEQLNEVLSYNGENNIINDVNVGVNRVMTDNTDIDSIMSEVTMYNEITQADIGKRVAVEGYESIGTLLFYGPHVLKDSMRCGVEFDEPVGKHNGTIYGHEYFKSVENRGVLVVPRKVTIIDNDNTTNNGILTVNEINDEEEPVVNDEEEPVVNDQEEPVVNDDEEPAVNDEEEPVVNDDEEPVVNDEEEPAVNDEEEPAVNDEEEPAVNDEEEPVVNEQEVNKYSEFIKKS